QDVEEDKPMRRDTIFRIASMTKPVTSVAVMILADEGKLKVTDPASKYLPEFKDAKVLVVNKGGTTSTVPSKREITVRDPLPHTPAIPYRCLNKPRLGDMYAKAGISDGLVETPGTTGDNVKKIARLPLWNQPGERWEYGLNTDVLGRLVEVVSGKTLDEV